MNTEMEEDAGNGGFRKRMRASVSFFWICRWSGDDDFVVDQIFDFVLWNLLGWRGKRRFERWN